MVKPVRKPIINMPIQRIYQKNGIVCCENIEHVPIGSQGKRYNHYSIVHHQSQRVTLLLLASESKQTYICIIL